MTADVISNDYVGRVFAKSCEQMDELPNGVVQTCVTSPPYWGLRSYEATQWEGGDPNCDHKRATSDKVAASTLASASANANQALMGWLGGRCGRCGAVSKESGQIGLEETLEEYLERIVAVFREVRRVLRSDGTLWLNVGDCYATGTNADRKPSQTKGDDPPTSWTSRCQSIRRHPPGLKVKDLVGIPWMVAFALRADGWWLRDAIVWHKPNAMPASVTDRCTGAYEMIFLLSKAPRYFFDADAIKEPYSEATLTRLAQPTFETQRGGAKDYRNAEDRNGNMSARRSLENLAERVATGEAGANKRNVWTIATTPYREAHFATFPLEVPLTCIRAGSRPGDLVLDPFMGSGTTAEAAEALGRRWVGYELCGEYHELIAKRLVQAGLFT